MTSIFVFFVVIIFKAACSIEFRPGGLVLSAVAEVLARPEIVVGCHCVANWVWC